MSRLPEARVKNVRRRQPDGHLLRLPDAAGRRSPDVRFRRHGYLLPRAAGSWYSAVGAEHRRRKRRVHFRDGDDVAVRRSVARRPAVSTRKPDEDQGRRCHEDLERRSNRSPTCQVFYLSSVLTRTTSSGDPTEVLPANCSHEDVERRSNRGRIAAKCSRGFIHATFLSFLDVFGRPFVNCNSVLG